MGVVVEMCPLSRSCLFVGYFFILDPVIYCSAWLRLKLNTKVGLHNFPPPDPPFSPPQTFEPLLSYLGRSNLVCKVYGTQLEKSKRNIVAI